MVRAALAFVMTILLVHLQVAGVMCVCAHEDGHGDSEMADDHEVDAAAPETPSSRDSDDSGEPDHHHGPSRCECGPSQPFAVPEAAPSSAPSRLLASLVSLQTYGSFSSGSGSHETDIPRPARPPPLVRCVSSTSPLSLSKLQI